jgi:hypothetical protein
MRSSLRGAIGLAAVGLLALAATPSVAQKAENKLLGIKTWNRWSDVLKKHGQPTRIEVGAVTSTSGGEAGAGGGMMGGGMMGGPMSGGMAPGGIGAMSPGGAPGGSPYGGGMMGGGMMSGRGRGGGMGLPGMGGMGPYGGGMGGRTAGGEGDLGGGAMAPGGAGGPMGPGGMGFAGGGGGSTETSEGEITWVYERGSERNRITDYFLFNKDGRVIQIQSFGYTGGSAVTERGVRLGDNVGKIYAKYGWTGQMSKDPQNNTMTLDYSKDYHCAFQLADLKNGKGYRVVGITVAITEKNDLGGAMQGMSFGGPMGGGMGGGPMMGGMGGGPYGGAMGPGMMRGRSGSPGGGGIGLPGGRGGGQKE